jgi:hypothetical protein
VRLFVYGFNICQLVTQCRVMKTYNCPQCQARIFFENMSCLSCGAQLGYYPKANEMRLAVAANDQSATSEPTAGALTDDTSLAVVVCANRSTAANCNWLTDVQPVKAGEHALCDCCRYTRTTPPLDKPEHQIAWQNLELAKRYLFYSLFQLRLPIPDRTQQPESGLAFDFLAQLPDAAKVMTGHANGIITINIAEADDVVRERRRIALHESYRTVLGHLRHEVGHFYWDQLIAKSEWLEQFRKVFGDERGDYAEALKSHYKKLDDGKWRGTFVSYYASSHPWEDWAETWAHYLHIMDALDTAVAWHAAIGEDRLLIQNIDSKTDDQQFRTILIEQWLPLCQYLNAACRSLGESDAYPFELPPAVVDKMAFIHAVVSADRHVA